MDYLKKMIEEENCVETLFKTYVELRRGKRYFCFFEGKDDDKYYYPRISAYIGEEAYGDLSCDGKENVLGLHEMVHENAAEIEGETRLFFVDKDFDISEKYDDDIYVTPTYSIENLYMSDKAIGKIVKGVWGIAGVIGEDDKWDYNEATKFLMQKRDELAKNILFSNAWYSLQRRKAKGVEDKPGLYKIKNYKDIMGISTVTELEEKVPNYIPVSEDELKDEMNRISKDPVKNLRGKYFEQYMTQYFKMFIDESNQSDATKRRYKRKHKVKKNICGDTIIDDFSCYADMPDCLVDYLKKNLA